MDITYRLNHSLNPQDVARCHLSDLAVAREYQGRGIGRELIGRTRSALGDHVTLILLSAPEAMTYYPQLGFEHADNAFFIRRSR